MSETPPALTDGVSETNHADATHVGLEKVNNLFLSNLQIRPTNRCRYVISSYGLGH